MVVKVMVQSIPRYKVWESRDERSCASRYEIIVKDFFILYFFLKKKKLFCSMPVFTSHRPNWGVVCAAQCLT